MMKGIRGLALIFALAALVGFGSTMKWSDDGGGVAHASPDCVTGAGGLAAYYFDGSYGTLSPSGGQPWVMTLTDIDGSAVTGNKVYMLMIQDHGTGSGWESLPTQVHDDFYGAGGHLLQSDDKDWTVRSSHGFNPGDVPGTFDLRVVMQQRDDGKWDISPYFRLPGGDWTLFYDGSWTTATAFNLTKTRLAVVIDAGAGGTLCFTAPTADGTDLSNVYVDDDWAGTDPTAEVESGKFFGVNAFATIQEGIDAVTPGGTVDVADGIYNETLKLDATKSQNISVIGSGASSTFLTGGIRFEGNYSGLDVEGFTITGDGRQRPGLSQATVGDSSSLVMVTDARFADNVFDGENVADRFGLYLDRLSGSFTFEGNEVKNYEGWGTLDLNQTYNPIASYTFNDNNIHDNKGSSALRGSSSDRTDTVVADGNTFDNNGGGDSWAALEINEAVSVTVTDNVITNTVAGSWGEGEALQFWHIDSLTVTGNTLDNNYQGIYFPGTDWASDLSGVEIHDNNITNSDQFGFRAEPENTGTADATDNWWGSANGPTHASNTFNVGAQGEVVSDHVNFTPWLDAPAPGGASFAPVTTTDPVGSWPSIQAGIDASNPGGTVNAADGTYTATSLASIVIAKDGLSLVGESRDGTIIDAGPWGTSSAGWPRGVHVYANDVTIRDLTVQGFTGDGVNTGGYGIVFRDWAHDMPAEGYIFYSGGLVDNVKLDNNYSSLYALVHRNLTVSNNLVQNSLADGMFIARESDNATVTGNTVLNSGNHGIWVGYCWSGLGPSDNAIITNNVVDGAIEGGISFVASNGAVISGNDVSHVKGEEPEGDFGGWSRGAISLKDGTSNVTVSNNVVHDNDGLGTGSGRGLGVDGTSSNITVTGNTIRDNAGGGIKVLGATSGWAANDNNIYGNSGYGAQNVTGAMLDFTDNWWGSANGPTHASNTFNVGAQGTGRQQQHRLHALARRARTRRRQLRARDDDRPRRQLRRPSRRASTPQTRAAR